MKFPAFPTFLLPHLYDPDPDPDSEYGFESLNLMIPHPIRIKNLAKDRYRYRYYYIDTRRKLFCKQISFMAGKTSRSGAHGTYVFIKKR
jgi:hypothetical protein